MMILRTGSFSTGQPFPKMTRGLSLIEVIAAVVILSVGIVGVYQPLLRSLAVLQDMEARLEANRLISDQIWQFQNDKFKLRSLIGKSIEGELIGQDHAYGYKMIISPISTEQALNRADIEIKWQASAGQSKRSAFVFYVLVPLL